MSAKQTLDLALACTRLLFANGQTTERTVLATKRLARGLGVRADVFPRWGKLTVRVEDEAGAHDEHVAARPAGVDMNKVIVTLAIVDQVHEGRLTGPDAKLELEKIDRFEPVPLVRFATMAGIGASALGIIFGVADPLSLGLIALSASLGALLRRWLAGMSHNLFVQPFCAALLAGIVGAVVVRLNLSSGLRLVAVCPCMVLVPGPHFLNGALDLARARVALGAARLVYAGMITFMICLGLVLGLALGGVSLPASGTVEFVPLGYDVLAAGVAVAAYGVFFNMPWRMLPVPIVIGMLAHASRWIVITKAGTSVEIGALVACLVVGIVITPIADRLRLPFAGVAFASVVSLIPGVYLFRVAGGLFDFFTTDSQTQPELFAQIIADTTMALLIILAMAVGLILPRLCYEQLRTIDRAA